METMDLNKLREILSERHLAIYLDRERDKKTYKQIAETYGFSTGRALQIYNQSVYRIQQAEAIRNRNASDQKDLPNEWMEGERREYIMTKMNDRAARIILAHEDGGKSFEEIATLIGWGNASYVEDEYKSSLEWLAKCPIRHQGLSTRASNCCMGAWMDRDKLGLRNKDEIRAAILDGRLTPGAKGTRNYGFKTHNEVLKWLGMPELPPAERKDVVAKNKRAAIFNDIKKIIDNEAEMSKTGILVALHKILRDH